MSSDYIYLLQDSSPSIKKESFVNYKDTQEIIINPFNNSMVLTENIHTNFVKLSKFM